MNNSGYIPHFALHIFNHLCYPPPIHNEMAYVQKRTFHIRLPTQLYVLLCNTIHRPYVYVYECILIISKYNSNAAAIPLIIIIIIIIINICIEYMYNLLTKKKKEKENNYTRVLRRYLIHKI